MRFSCPCFRLYFSLLSQKQPLIIQNTFIYRYTYPCKIYCSFVSVLKINENGIMLYISLDNLGILSEEEVGRNLKKKAQTHRAFASYSFCLEHFPTFALQ